MDSNYAMAMALRRPNEQSFSVATGLMPRAVLLAGLALVAACTSAQSQIQAAGAADEAIGANVVADSDRAAAGIAKQLSLSALFARQGWTS